MTELNGPVDDGDLEAKLGLFLYGLGLEEDGSIPASEVIAVVELLADFRRLACGSGMLTLPTVAVMEFGDNWGYCLATELAPGKFLFLAVRRWMGNPCLVYGYHNTVPERLAELPIPAMAATPVGRRGYAVYEQPGGTNLLDQPATLELMSDSVTMALSDVLAD